MTIQSYTQAADRDSFARQFCELPGAVRQDLYRKGLLPADIWHSFLNLPAQSPSEFWIAAQGSKTLARIGAGVSSQNAKMGYVGFLEFDPEDAAGIKAAEALLEWACEFLKAKGVQYVYGPIQINTWFPYRFRLTQDDERFFAWEPVHPPGYLHVLKAAGFAEAYTYHSTAYGDLEGFLEKLKPAHEAVAAEGHQIRGIDRNAIIHNELPTLHRMSQEAFQDNVLFEPIPFDLFKALYVRISDKTQQYSKIVTSPAGKDVGFLFGFMDASQNAKTGTLESYFVIKSLAVLPEARGRGLSNALVYAAVKDGFAAGAGYAVSAMVRAGIPSESFQKKGTFFWQHRYGLFRKEL